MCIRDRFYVLGLAAGAEVPLLFSAVLLALCLAAALFFVRREKEQAYIFLFAALFCAGSLRMGAENA